MTVLTRPVPRRRPHLGGASRAVVLVLVIAFLFSPAVVVTLTSFTAGGYPHFPPQGWSLRWYRAAWDDPQLVSSFGLSVRLAVSAAALSTALGLMTSFALTRHSFVGKAALENLFMAPLALPHLVLGVGLLGLFSSLKLSPSFASLLLGHVLITAPFAIRMTTAALLSFDPTVERAAMTLGASYPTVLRTITFPALRSGLFGALVFSFILSFDEVSMTLFLSGTNTTTLPVRMYGYIEQSATPKINAASAVVLLFGLFALWAVERAVGLGHVLGAESDGARRSE